MTPQRVDEHTLIADAADPAAAVALVEELLRDRGLDAWDVHELNLPAAVGRAWWGGDEFGFVGRDHPAAEQVTVVRLSAAVLP